MFPRQGQMPKGKSVGCSQSTTSCRQKTLRRCKTNGKADNVVLIDLDSDDFHNVIDVDVPETLLKKSRLGKVITIDDDDDDDDDDENSDINAPGAGGASGDHLNNDASTSGRFPPASNHTHNSVDEDGDECEIIQDNLSPFKISKCKRTYSEKSSSRNRYGLSPDSDIDLSGDDLPDTVLMEDSCGKVREQWEKANMKRKCDVLNGQFGNCNEATASRLYPTRKKDRPSPGTSNARNDEDKPSPLGKDVDDMFRTYSSEDPFADLDVHSTPLGHYSKGINPKGQESCPAGPSSNNHEGNTNECNNASFFAEENYQSPGPSLFSSHRRDNQEVNHVDSQHKGPIANSGIEKDQGCRQVPDETIAKESSFCSDPRNEVHTELNMGATDLSKESDDQVHSEDVDDGHTIHLNIINDKEKLKETDEYKRAAEEEWASRQRELQIQAEEAQRLRRLVKRKKAESMRLLDMERRQKQRVEEMREIQKKDVENMNMKEQLRAEIRQDLNQLEITCSDMATLLRGLGIQVGSGIQPLPQEVRAAYKRALLSFHPDRASGSDIRQLVEAEEKFKLISRMKEKLLVA